MRTSRACRLWTEPAHRLLVIEHEQIIGIISTTDIVRAVAEGKL